MDNGHPAPLLPNPPVLHPRRPSPRQRPSQRLRHLSTELRCSLLRCSLLPCSLLRCSLLPCQQGALRTTRATRSRLTTLWFRPLPKRSHPSRILPPPPHGVCSDGRSSAYETDVDCGGVCEPCAIDEACRDARDCTSGLCREGLCRERLYASGEPVPPGYHLEPSNQDRASTARKAGIGFFALSYGAAYIAALSAPSSVAWLYVPLIGPWPLIHKAKDFAPENGVRMTKLLLVSDGALQIAGALMWLGGSLGRGQQLLRDPQAPPSATAKPIWVSASLSADGYQVDVRGLF